MTDNQWQRVKFFKPAEFDSKDKAGTGKDMNAEFVYRLDMLRMLCGFPLIINSGYRTPKHNKAVGGKPSSAHLKGLAADIQVSDSRQRFQLKRLAHMLGFRRIGNGATFVHLDLDESLPQDVEWNY
jgi:uncharacterized protein YcbK (DUF882 family)